MKIQNITRRLPTTVPIIKESKNSSKKLVAVTAYDYTSALIVEEAEVDIILVGDSLGCVIQGHDNTIPVTLDEVIYHTRCVARGVHFGLLVADLPFMSYQISIQQAVESSFRLIKEAGAQAVKLEGGAVMADTVRKLTQLDIPVMGHIGLTPQSIHRMGGWKIQGKSLQQSNELLTDAKALADAGAFSIVVEGVPDVVTKTITESINIPVIGIGAGSDCDGQILVFHDLLGLQKKSPPKFVKKYADLFSDAVSAINKFKHEVQELQFPSSQYSYGKRVRKE